MGNSQGHLFQLFNRKNYNDTAYDAICQVPLVTIDREEIFAPKAPLTYIVTFSNNIEASKNKLDDLFKKIKNHNFLFRQKSHGNESQAKAESERQERDFNVLLVPVDDLSSFSQKPFTEIKQGLQTVIPAEMREKSLTLIKTNLKDSGCPLIKFIGYQTDKPFVKSANLFVAENFPTEDPRSGKAIYQSKIQQID